MKDRRIAKRRRSTKLLSSNSSAPRWRPPPPRARNAQPRRNRPAHLVDFIHPVLTRLLRAAVFEIWLPRRKIQFHGLEVLVRYLMQQMRDAVQPRALLVVGIHDVPGRNLTIRMLEHDVLGA